MRLHAVETGTVRIHERQRRGSGRGLGRALATMMDDAWTEPLPILAWVVEHPEGLIVVDTGETARTAEPGYFPWWHPYYRWAVDIAVRPEEEIGPRLRALGLPPDEVRWVVLTHLHTDHAGGLAHFRNSQLLVARAEYRVATGVRGRLRGYLPQHWPDWLAPRLLDFGPRAYGPFPESVPLTEAGDVVLVSTPGHSAGHLSVIVELEHETIFLAGDTSYTEACMLDEIVDGVAPLGAGEMAARRTLRRVRELASVRPMVYLPSHDPGSVGRLTARRTVADAGWRRATSGLLEP